MHGTTASFVAGVYCAKVLKLSEREQIDVPSLGDMSGNPAQFIAVPKEAVGSSLRLVWSQ